MKFEGKTTANIEICSNKKGSEVTNNNQTNTPTTWTGLDGKAGHHHKNRQKQPNSQLPKQIGLTGGQPSSASFTKEVTVIYKKSMAANIFDSQELPKPFRRSATIFFCARCPVSILNLIYQGRKKITTAEHSERRNSIGIHRSNQRKETKILYNTFDGPIK